MRARRWMTLLCATALVLAAPAAAAASPPGHPDRTEPEVLVSGLQGSFGSTVGPDGALYVTEGIAGRIVRIDPGSGETSTFADCLPKRIFGPGGATDVAFLGRRAYALVTLVDASVPGVEGTSVSGIYRIDDVHTCTVVADIGAFAIAHPPQGDFPIAVPSGLQYAFEPFGHGFVVTDGHHNRLYRVTLGGHVSQLLQLPNIVPTGLAVRRHTLLLAEAGPVPHLPQDGHVVAYTLPALTRPGTVLAAGAPLVVDVEPGAEHQLFALSQGHFTPGQPPGSPADPGTGSLLRVNGSGGFDVVTEGLDRPTSLEVVGSTAYVVTLGGKVLRIDHLPESGETSD
jgi:hypothetical protein